MLSKDWEKLTKAKSLDSKEAKKSITNQFDKIKALVVASFSTLKPFIPLESKANECKENRNRAYVKIGLCYKNMGDIKNAVTYLHKALDLLDVEDLVHWAIAKDAMAEILEFKEVK